MVQGREQGSFPHGPPLWGAEHLSPSSCCCDGSCAASPLPPSFAFLYRGLWICRALYLILPRLWNPPAYQRNGLENKTSLAQAAEWQSSAENRFGGLWECWEFQKLWEEPVWIWIRGLQVVSVPHNGLRGFCAVVGMVLPHSHGDLGLSLRILLQGGSPGMERLDFPDERASLWMYIHFAGHHHYAAEHRHW